MAISFKYAAHFCYWQEFNILNFNKKDARVGMVFISTTMKPKFKIKIYCAS
jgi:hypothetical protein